MPKLLSIALAIALPLFTVAAAMAADKEKCYPRNTCVTGQLGSTPKYICEVVNNNLYGGGDAVKVTDLVDTEGLPGPFNGRSHPSTVQCGIVKVLDETGKYVPFQTLADDGKYYDIHCGYFRRGASCDRQF